MRCPLCQFPPDLTRGKSGGQPATWVIRTSAESFDFRTGISDALRRAGSSAGARKRGGRGACRQDRRSPIRARLPGRRGTRLPKGSIRLESSGMGGPFPAVSEQGVGEDEELAHHRHERQLLRFAGGHRRSKRCAGRGCGGRRRGRACRGRGAGPRPPPMKARPRHWPELRVRGATRPGRRLLALHAAELGHLGQDRGGGGRPEAGVETDRLAGAELRVGRTRVTSAESRSCMSAPPPSGAARSGALQRMAAGCRRQEAVRSLTRPRGSSARPRSSSAVDQRVAISPPFSVSRSLMAARIHRCGRDCRIFW